MTTPVTPQGGEPAAGATPVPAVVSRKEVSDFILRLTARHGSTENALNQLAGDQLKYRKRAQSAERERDEFKKLVPAAGSVVLSGDEAKHFAALKTAGVDLAKVPDQLKELGSLKTQSTATTRAAALAKAAGEGDDAKYNPKLLAKILGDVELEFKTVKVKGTDKDGKATIDDVEVPHIVTTSAAGVKTTETLDDYLLREHEDFMDVLTVEPSANAGTTRSAAASPAPTSGARTTTQRRTPTGTSTAAKDAEKVVDATLGSKYMSPGQRQKADAATRTT